MRVVHARPIVCMHVFSIECVLSTECVLYRMCSQCVLCMHVQLCVCMSIYVTHSQHTHSHTHTHTHTHKVSGTIFFSWGGEEVGLGPMSHRKLKFQATVCRLN